MVKEPVAGSRDAGHADLTRRKFIGVGAIAGWGFCSSGVERHALLKALAFAGDNMSAHRDNNENVHLKWDVFVTPSISSQRELYDQMLARYPEWLNRGALWSSAIAAKN